ncbi:MAG: hypothetical protein D6718_07475 [Acidobacteria bacterium]|nr:MAG: hypothetical protein D6718_07475 [Acidobacteriota bacterium]
MSLPFDVAGLALWLVAFLLSATCHEAAHAAAARLGGDPTAYRAGQVTLNPIPHLRREPFGMLVVPIVCYALAGWMIGWASAPYDPRWARRHPRRAAAMAAAGPLANLALAGAAIVAIRALVGAGLGAPPAEPGLERIVVPAVGGPFAMAGARLLSVLALLNAMLGVFNLIPLPPLDGATVLEGLGGRAGAALMAAARSAPMAALFGLLVAWRLFDLLAPGLFRLVLGLAQPGLR